MGCIHAFVGEAAAVRVLVNLCGRSEYVASFHSSKEQFCLCGCRALQVVTDDGGGKGIEGTVDLHPVNLVTCACLCLCTLKCA